MSPPMKCLFSLHLLLRFLSSATFSMSISGLKKKMFPVLLLLLVVDSVKQTIHAHIPGFRVALDKSLILGAASYSDARVKTGVRSGERYWL